MAQVEINGHVFDVDMIVFDKDGTLIELDIGAVDGAVGRVSAKKICVHR